MTQLIYDSSATGGSSYSHDDDEVAIRLHYRSIFDTFHRRMGEIQTWQIFGVKQAANQSALTTALNSLENAYRYDFGDVTFKDNSAADTTHSVLNGTTFSGVQVAHFSYPQPPVWDMQTEYHNKRTFQIVLTAEKRWGPANAVYGYRERIRQIGTGGPLRRNMGSLAGSPVLQTLRQITPIRYIQEGYVIGRGVTLSAPSPLPLGDEMYEQRVIEVNSPKDIRVQGRELYMTTYRYVFETVLPSVVNLTQYPIVPFP